MTVERSAHPRRRGVWMAGATALVAAVGLVSGAVGAVAAPSAAPVAATAAVAHNGCLPNGETAAATAGPYAVGERTYTFIDHSRPTPPDPSRGLPGLPYRKLVTTVLYPARGAATSPTPVVDAKAAHGRFPLIEFTHGVTATGPEYVPVLEYWAQAGYVIAAPTEPLSSGPGGVIWDVVNQPGDVTFVVNSMYSVDHDAGDPLHDRLAPGCVGISGHSLGAVTTLSTVYDSGCSRPVVRAAVSISGLLLPICNGNFAHNPPTPLLLLHGNQDGTIPISFSQAAFDQLRGNRSFVTFVGAGHVGLMFPPYMRILNADVIAFWNQWLKGSGLLVHLLHQQVQQTTLITFQHAG